MKQAYLEALDKLIDLVERSRDVLLSNHEKYEESLGALIFLGDKRYGAYSSMVETNEYRATKVIESLAVSLFSEYNTANFSFYPVAPVFKALPETEQAKSRPFQIVLTENGKKCGVVFSDISDLGKYCKAFEDGCYAVEALKLIVIAAPDEFSKDALFTSVNEMNDRAGLPVERIPIMEFWAQYFGETERDELIEFCKQFNEQAKAIIGFSTVITPTEKALAQFREKCGKSITTHNYTANMPDTVYSNQVETIKRNYLDRGLWRAMVGKSNFAVSFITSEWFYTMYQLTENLDLTNIVAGYLKSIEQLLFAVIQLSEGTGITIKSKGRDIVQFSEENADIIDTTLGALEQVIEHNGRILDVNKYAREHLVSTIDDWRDKQRNGYFHKHNLYDTKKVDEIREKALQLYFLILGSCTIKDNQFSALGIDIE